MSARKWLDLGRLPNVSLGVEPLQSLQALATALTAAGARLEIMPGVADLPDMVFPANAAVVLDRRALVARFRHPERQREEQRFQERFRAP